MKVIFLINKVPTFFSLLFLIGCTSAASIKEVDCSNTDLYSSDLKYIFTPIFKSDEVESDPLLKRTIEEDREIRIGKLTKSEDDLVKLSQIAPDQEIRLFYLNSLATSHKELVLKKINSNKSQLLFGVFYKDKEKTYLNSFAPVIILECTD